MDKDDGRPLPRGPSSNSTYRRGSSTLSSRRSGARGVEVNASDPELAEREHFSECCSAYTRGNPHRLDAVTRMMLSGDDQHLRSRSAPSSTWSDFVSNSRHHLEERTKPLYRELAGELERGAVDLNLPRILVDGGFLWKIPYHNSGTPKRRWFQIKPADGLLTTADGRLLVRPGGGGHGHARGSTEATPNGAVAGTRDEDDTARLTRIRAASPLCLVWMDPDRDLERFAVE